MAGSELLQTLALDLDETLLHTTNDRRLQALFIHFAHLEELLIISGKIRPYDQMFFVRECKGQLIATVLRPFVRSFLQKLSTLGYMNIIWSAGLKRYVIENAVILTCPYYYNCTYDTESNCWYTNNNDIIIPKFEYMYSVEECDPHGEVGYCKSFDRLKSNLCFIDTENCVLFDNRVENSKLDETSEGFILVPGIQIIFHSKRIYQLTYC